jgi:hypothetical protein
VKLSLKNVGDALIFGKAYEVCCFLSGVKMCICGLFFNAVAWAAVTALRAEARSVINHVLVKHMR